MTNVERAERLLDRIERVGTRRDKLIEIVKELRHSPSALLRGNQSAEKEDAGERAANDPAPERKGEIAARILLEPEGGRAK